MKIGIALLLILLILPATALFYKDYEPIEFTKPTKSTNTSSSGCLDCCNQDKFTTILNCTKGLDCEYSKMCKNYGIMGNWNTETVSFNAVPGNYDCEITVRRGQFGYYDPDPFDTGTQPNETITLRVNNVTFGTSNDPFCNYEEPRRCSSSCPYIYYDRGDWRPNEWCFHCDFDVISVFSGNVDLQTRNTIYLDFKQSHSFDFIRIECERICEGCQTDADCDDGQYCNGEETCNRRTGECEEGSPVDCSRLDDQCNIGVCNERLDKCEKQPVEDGTACNDGLWCISGEVCIEGECTNGEERDCSQFDLPPIRTCFNTPDSNPYTWDYFSGFTSVCDEEKDKCTQGTQTIESECSILKCDAECESDSDCSPTECDPDGCKGNDYYDYEDSVENKCIECECEQNECKEPKIYYNDPRCTECQTDEDCSDLDRDYCEGTVIKHDRGRCIEYSCKVETTTERDCDDKQYCNGEETCKDATCIAGTPIDCTPFNLSPVETCFYTPDSNPLTWDFFAGFTSECDEGQDRCTKGGETIESGCDIAKCNAECEFDSDCEPTECEPDGCKGDDYYDYDDEVENSCLESCECEQNECREPTIYYNDPRCTECQTDEDCSDLDRDYCEGTVIKHDKGRCIEYECKLETTTERDCDDGLYCNGEETCSNATCIQGTPIECYQFNLSPVETCFYTPDSNPLTWDFFAGFTSECDEGQDRCTKGGETIESECSILKCDAECEEDEDCQPTECEPDGCKGDDYYDYDDEVENSCLESCECEQNECREPTIYYNDPRCTECQTDEDCSDLDRDYCEGTLIKHDEGICDNYVCKVETTEAEDCGERDGIMNDCGLMEWSCSEELNQVSCVITNINPKDDLCSDYCDRHLRKLGYCNTIKYRCEYETEDCDDALYCNGQETCDPATINCIQGTPIDCTPFNLPPVETCFNTPDSNPLTWDFFAGFTSECDEDHDRCTQGQETIESECSILKCNAECESDSDCEPTECEPDGCKGDDYYDYDDEVENSCLESCECEQNECREPTIYYNDPRCTECQTDEDCSDLDRDYCEGTVIKHDRGRCIEYSCELETTTERDCDDGLYCNGEETCSNATCIQGTPIECYQFNLSPVETCFYTPDSNPLTWDYFSGFISVCDEDNDRCTTGTEIIESNCDIARCDAECESDSDCEPTECEPDGCKGDDYYDYDDSVENSCIECECEQNQCREPTIYYNDPRCTECQTDEDCSDLDRDYCEGTVIKHDRGRCIEYSCELETTTERDCDDKQYCNGQETCSNATCIQGTPIECYQFNLSPVETCFYTPDSNPLTWDFFAGFTSECDEGQDRCTKGGETIESECSILKCDAECEEDEDCQPTECEPDGCKGDDYYDYDDEVENSCLESCECEQNECGEPTIYYNDPRCTECQTDEDCSYLDRDYCEGTVIKHDRGRCIEYSCELETTTERDCDDGLYCNGEETCSNATCIQGTPIECYQFNLSPVETCFYTPDSNPLTWDYFSGFISVCDEDNDRCTTGTEIIESNCDIARCDAECESDSDCEPTECEPDGCKGDDYYDYDDSVENSCLESCECEQNQCREPTIYHNDPRCTECQTDEDCSYLDRDYCEGTVIKHDKGRCIEYECKAKPLPEEDCDDKQYCNGQETCSNAACIQGTPIECYQFNLPPVETCFYTPDSNPLTWDYFSGFISVCDEDNDRCTTGTETIQSSCDIAKCDAECEEDEDCSPTECEPDGCKGDDYYDYDDSVENSCLESCECEQNQCREPTIYHNDPRCTECQTDEDCSYLDRDYCEGTVIKHDKGRCIEYECKAKPLPEEDCDDKQYCNGQETCSNAACIQGIPIDCNPFNLPPVGQCDYVPDGFPKTFDFFPGFTSICNEELDICTQGQSEIESSCSIEKCNAECESKEDCRTFLEGDYCFFNGSCSLEPDCECSFEEEFCPEPGTIKEGYCYWGQRDCLDEDGCSLNVTPMDCYEICDPYNGPIGLPEISTVKKVGNPKIECDYLGEKDEAEECWLVTSGTEFSLETDYSEADSYYRQRWKENFGDWWEEWSNWILYIGSFTFGEDSIHELEYYSIDKVCDIEEEHHFEIDIVDMQAPEPVKVVGEPKEPCGAGQDCDWKITIETEIELSCVDPEPHPSGSEMVCYRYFLDGSLEQDWVCEDSQVVIIFDEECLHQLDFYCKDLLGNESEIDSELFKVGGTSFRITLNKKWNLISIPFVPLNPEIGVLLEEIIENVESVWSQDGGEWHIFRPNDPGASTLHEMMPGYGYWISMYEDDELLVSGSLFSPDATPPSRQLDEGWNLIGYYGTDGLTEYNGPAGNGKEARCALYSLGSSLQDKGWTELRTYWEPDNPNQWKDLGYYDRMDPGAGYWISIPESGLYSYTSRCEDLFS